MVEITPDNWIVKYTEHYGEHPIFSPHTRTDYPHRHPSKARNEQAELMSKEEIDAYFELEGKLDNINLGS